MARLDACQRSAWLNEHRTATVRERPAAPKAQSRKDDARLGTTACIAPVLVSNVSSENTSEQGGRGDAVGGVTDTTARITVCVPVPPELANGRRAVAICPDVTVNGVALPITAPLAL
jgi:hypothetical protein